MRWASFWAGRERSGAAWHRWESRPPPPGCGPRSFPDAHDVFCAAVHEAGGGNPWLIGELARDLAGRRVDPGAAGATTVHAAAPESVAGTVMRRARALAPEAADLLEAAAVLGPGSEPRHAAALAGLDRAQAARMGDRLAAAGVLADEGGLTFVHPAVQAAVRLVAPRGRARRGAPAGCHGAGGGGRSPGGRGSPSAPGQPWRWRLGDRGAAAHGRARSGAGRGRSRRGAARAGPAGAVLAGGPGPCAAGARDGGGDHRIRRGGRPPDGRHRSPARSGRARAGRAGCGPDPARTGPHLGRGGRLRAGGARRRRGSDLGGLLRAGRATVLRMLRGRAGVVAEARRGARRGWDGHRPRPARRDVHRRRSSRGAA